MKSLELMEAHNLYNSHILALQQSLVVLAVYLGTECQLYQISFAQLRRENGMVYMTTSPLYQVLKKQRKVRQAHHF